jgi:hypothetical protein
MRPLWLQGPYLNNGICAFDNMLIGAGRSSRGRTAALLGYVAACPRVPPWWCWQATRGSDTHRWQYGLGKTAAWNSDINRRMEQELCGLGE